MMYRAGSGSPPSISVLLTACLLLSSCTVPVPPNTLTAAPTGNSLSACPVTRAPQPRFVPPAPYPAQPPQEYTGQFWYGTPALWTMLMSDGIWSDLPKTSEGYTQKVFWWSASYNVEAEPVPNLHVTGRRLDALGQPITASTATNALADFGQAMLVGVNIPTLGCWQITGRYRGQDLSFVVWIAR